MLHGETAIFISLHPGPPVCRDLECIRKINVVTELNLDPLFQKKAEFFTTRKAWKSRIYSAETTKINLSSTARKKSKN